MFKNAQLVTHQQTGVRPYSIKSSRMPLLASLKATGHFLTVVHVVAAYLSPRLTQECIGLAYKGEYYTHSSNEEEKQTPKTLRAYLVTGLINHYLNEMIGGNRKPSYPIGHYLLNKVFINKKDLLDRAIRNLNRRDGTRLLDLGCGDGSFLPNMQNIGWTTYGVEPDPIAARLCVERGLDVHPSLDDYPNDFVDAITLDHVIEHVHFPIKTIRACMRSLRPNGKIWIATPNIESRGHERFGPDWLGLDPPRHLVIYSMKALQELLEEAGFTGVTFLNSYLSPGWTYQWSNQIKAQNDGIPFADQQIFSWIEEDRSLPSKLAEELVVVGFKPNS